MATTTNSLVDKIKTTITIPDNQVLLTNERMIEFMNEEIDAELVPLITSVNQDYLVAQEDEATVDGIEAYDIPYRSIGRTLRDLKISDGSNVRNVTKIALEDAHMFRTSSIPQSFYFKGDKIIMVPTPNSSSIILQKFYLIKPSRLTLVENSGQIVGISGTTLTLSNVPSTFTATTSIDMIQGKQGNSIKSMDATISSVSGNQIVVSAVPSAPAALVVGDYIALACETPVLQLPDEIVPLLVFLGSKRCLEALGDYEGSKALEDDIKRRKRLFEKLIAPRAEGASTKIMNRYGLLKGYRGRYTRGIIY